MRNVHLEGEHGLPDISISEIIKSLKESNRRVAKTGMRNSSLFHKALISQTHSAQVVSEF
jgi:hypothetical protein